MESELKRDMQDAMDQAARQNMHAKLSLPLHDGPELHGVYAMINYNIAPAVLDRFLSKGQDYGEAYALLGVQGQFSDINRKFHKLKRALWDGEKLKYESPSEVIEDLIGHCYLTLALLQKEREEKMLAVNVQEECDAAQDRDVSLSEEAADKLRMAALEYAEANGRFPSEP